ncbi:MAG: tetratricopeptide repeat protein [Ignavibacteriae bacterium]|nr:tetratricopeptide repeat protein [Ignavibacteriota bacterium]
MNPENTPAHLPFYLTIISAFLFVATMMVFVNSVNAEFVNWDDDIYVTENPLVQSLTVENVKGILSTSYYYGWTPVTLLSHAIDFSLWGMNAKGHHLTNVLLHAINTVLLFFVTIVVIDSARARDERTLRARITPSMLVGSLIGALLFAMHPLRVESVAWVSGRKDLLCTLFLLISLWTYIIWKQRGKKRLHVVSMIAFALALLSKPTAIIFPIVLILLDALLLNKTEGRSAWNEILIDKIGFLVLSGIAAVITWLAASGGGVNVIGELNAIERVLLPFYMITFYLVKLVVPLDLSPVYPDVDTVLLYLSPLIVIGLLSVGYVLMKRQIAAFMLAVASYMLMLLPVYLGISSGLQPLADRYTYLSTLSIFMLIGGGIDLYWRASAASAGKKYQRELLAFVLLCLCAVSAYRTIRHASVWHDSVSLWKQALRYAPQTIDEFNRRRPYMKPSYADARLNLGVAYYTRKNVDSALVQFQTVLRFDSCNADAHYNIGNVLYEKAETALSLRSFERAVRCDSRYAKAFYNLGILYAAQDSVALALQSFQSAARLGYADAQRILTERGYGW